jgi:thioredoxin 1
MNKNEKTQVSKKREPASIQTPPTGPILVDDATFSQTVNRYPFVVIDCWAPWCMGPCQAIGRLIENIAKEYAGRVVFGQLNVDENSETTKRFEISGIPTLLIIKNGKEIERNVGAVSKKQIEAMLQKYL